MSTLRAIGAGVIVWILIFTLFTVMSFVPGLNESETKQYFVLFIAMILFVGIGAAFYYKGGLPTHGLAIGMVMALTAIVLDAVITVPLVMWPLNKTHLDLFANPLFVTTFFEYLAIVFLYWRLKVSPKELSTA